MSSRRRLRVICSSDEEEYDDDIQEVQPPPPQQHHDIDPETLNLQDVTLNSFNTTNPPDCIQLELSDDDFIDAFDDLSPPPQPPPSHQPVNSSEYSGTSSVGMNQVSDCPVSRILEDLGLRLRPEWLDACLRGLQTAVPGFSSFDATKKAKLCFEKFLLSDMNYSGAGMLPHNVHQMHLIDLPGPFVLQVDEIVNISQPLRERYKKAPSGLKRCLKLSMTDGVQRVFGMEYQPIKDLDALAPAGLKVAISNVNVRHGLLMLVPEVLQVLGGLVEELDAARQRLVNEVNKPPRGKRTRSGVVPPLATRATRAAWPADDVNSSGAQNNPISYSTTPMQVDNQGTTPASVNERVSSNSAIPVSTRGENIGNQPSRVELQSSVTNRRAHIGNQSSRVEVETFVSTRRENVVNQLPRVEAESFVSERRENSEPSIPPKAATESCNHMHAKTATFAAPVFRETVETPPLRVREEATVSFPITVPDDGDVFMVADEDNYSAVSRSSESPFTYMASLSVKWSELKDKASHVEGKIKCFLTGVKGFQFKKRNTYELQVYVDDGSLISEILVDHNVVQKKIGYSPEEVNTALSSSDSSRVQAMKDTMKQFQVFLVNFEGTMVVRINEASSLPVAIEMQQGCSASDAWMLLTRLKSDQRPPLDPITLSP